MSIFVITNRTSQSSRRPIVLMKVDYLRPRPNPLNIKIQEIESEASSIIDALTTRQTRGPILDTYRNYLCGLRHDTKNVLWDAALVATTIVEEFLS